jgi:MFS family permease
VDAAEEAHVAAHDVGVRVPVSRATDRPSREVTTLAPLRVPEYRRVFVAAVVSNLGFFLQMTAAPWLMNDLTRSPLLVALVTTALTLPRLLLTVPAGALADAVDRRTLIITGQVISACAVAAMAVLTALGTITPTSLLALSFVLGIGSAIELPSFQTLVPDLVPRPLVPQAITLNSAAFNVARSVGPAIGGALVATGLTSVAFGANAVSYLGLIGVLLSFPRSKVEDPARQTLLRSTAVGVRYVRFTRPIRILLAVTAVFSLTTASVQALLPVVAVDLGLGGTGFGVLYGLFGLGALVAAMTRERVRLLAAARMLPGSMVLFGVGGVAFGLAPTPGTAGAALFVAGLSWVWTLTTLNATVQLLAPRWVRGRVVSLYLLAVGSQPIGAFGAGALAEGVGAGLSVALFCGGAVVLGILAARWSLPVLGELDVPTTPEGWAMPRHAREVGGSPILVATTWQIDLAEARAFLAVMRELRRQRFRTGAHRWSLYRDADHPDRVTEYFAVHSWSEHLAQHARIDTETAEVIARARAFDRAGGPVTRHLAGLDVTDSDPAALD